MDHIMVTISIKSPQTLYSPAFLFEPHFVVHLQGNVIVRMHHEQQLQCTDVLALFNESGEQYLSQTLAPVRLPQREAKKEDMAAAAEVGTASGFANDLS